MSALLYTFPSVKHCSNLLFSFSHLVTCLPSNNMLPVVIVIYNSDIFYNSYIFSRHFVNNVVITLTFFHFLILLFLYFFNLAVKDIVLLINNIVCWRHGVLPCSISYSTVKCFVNSQNFRYFVVPFRVRDQELRFQLFLQEIVSLISFMNNLLTLFLCMF
jgi:hypothetical protein